MGIVKLWTIQHHDFFKDDNPSLIANWDRVPNNWRPAYDWMVLQWAKRVGQSLSHAPIWCWHSVDGVYGKPPTVGTASLLLGHWGNADSMYVCELDAPEELALLSSYHIWNNLLEFVITNPNLDIPDSIYLSMFDAPLLQSKDDDVQAVLPFLDQSWIVRVSPLPQSNHDWEMAI